MPALRPIGRGGGRAEEARAQAAIAGRIGHRQENGKAGGEDLGDLARRGERHDRHAHVQRRFASRP